MRSKYTIPLLTLLGMIILILDTKTALCGASDGIELCLRTVIPSLFPLCMLSTLLTNTPIDTSFPPMRILCRLLHTSPAGVSIFLSGILGGYPMGAQGIAAACKEGRLDQNEGRRLLAFCNNAGPAFLFGIGATLFDGTKLCFLAWGIHLLSAIIVAAMTPGRQTRQQIVAKFSSISISNALSKSIKTMAMVCGWVILFRVLIHYLAVWVLWWIPDSIQILIFGLLEISNGCVLLSNLQSPAHRFLFFTTFLSFGGLCVTMQTYSVVSDCNLNFRHYLMGKITQTAITFLLAYICQFLFPPAERISLSFIFPILCIFIIFGYRIFVKKQKKDSIPMLVGV